MAQQEIDEIKKANGGVLLEESDVMWIQILEDWQIDDSYVYMA